MNKQKLYASLKILLIHKGYQLLCIPGNYFEACRLNWPTPCNRSQNRVTQNGSPYCVTWHGAILFHWGQWILRHWIHPSIKAPLLQRRSKQWWWGKWRSIITDCTSQDCWSCWQQICWNISFAHKYFIKEKM